MTAEHRGGLQLSARAWMVAACLAVAGCATFEQPAVQHEEPRPDVLDAQPVPEPDDDLLYQVLVAELSGAAGDIEQSVAAWRRAMVLTDDPRIAERATQLALYSEMEEAALEAAERWAKLVDEPPVQLHQILGFLYLRDGQAEPAGHHLRHVLVADEQPPEELFERLKSALGTEQARGVALEVVQGLVEEYPGHPAGYRLLAGLALRAGEPALALESADDGLALEPDDRDLALLRVEALLAMGQLDQVLQGLEAMLAAHPGDWQLRLDYARILLDAGYEQKALAEFERLHAERPDNADALYATALLTLEAGYPEEARGYFLALVDLGERLGAAHYFLGRIAEDEGEETAALHWYGMVDGEYADQAGLRRAVILGGQGRIARSREAFDEFRARYPEHAIRAFLMEGEVLRRAARLDEAAELYDEALRAHPDQSDLLYGRALLKVARDDVEQAEADLRRILEQNPDHTHALNALGYTLVDMTDRHEEGFELVQRAYRQEPGDPAILDSMGWAHFRLGNTREALRYLQKAYDRQPDGEIAAHLGEVLWELDERERARQVWREALEREPRHEVLRETLNRLAPAELDQ